MLREWAKDSGFQLAKMGPVVGSGRWGTTKVGRTVMDSLAKNINDRVEGCKSG